MGVLLGAILVSGTQAAPGHAERASSSGPSTPFTTSLLRQALPFVGDPHVPDFGVAPFRHVIRSLCEWDGALWVGTYGSGVHVLRGATVTTLTSATSPLNENRVNVAVEHGKELWLGTCAGFAVHDGKSWRRQTKADGMGGDIYHAGLSDPRTGRLWIGTVHGGVCYLEHGRWVVVPPTSGLNQTWINALALDPAGALWVVGLTHVWSQGKGDTFQEETIPWPRQPSAPTSLAVRGSEVWVGSGFAGVAMKQGGRWSMPPTSLLPSSQVNHLATDEQDQLWIATDRGIVRYHPERGWKTYGAAEGVVDGNVRLLYHGRATKTLWAGSFLQGYVYRYDPSRDRFQAVLHQGRLVADPGQAR